MVGDIKVLLTKVQIQYKLSSDELYLSHTQLYRYIMRSEMCSLH